MVVETYEALSFLSRMNSSSSFDRHVNFLGGSPLNRLSWLRSSTPFLNAVLASKETKWILFQNGQPLVSVQGAVKERSLTKLSTTDIKHFLGPDPIFGQGKELGQTFEDEVTPPVLEASRIHGPAIVFLGLHEPEGVEVKSALPSSEFSAKTDPKLAAANIQGIPYFALDVSDADEDGINTLLSQNSVSNQERSTYEFAEPRGASGSLNMFEAAVFAEARSMIDWNTRNKVKFTLCVSWKFVLTTCSSAQDAVLRCIQYGRAGNCRAQPCSRGRTILTEGLVLRRKSYSPIKLYDSF